MRVSTLQTSNQGARIAEDTEVPDLPKLKTVIFGRRCVLSSKVLSSSTWDLSARCWGMNIFVSAAIDCPPNKLLSYLLSKRPSV